MSSSCHLTDAGNAEFFARLYNGKLKYNWMLNQWYEWNRVRWARCDTDQQVEFAVAALRKRRKLAENISDLPAKTKEINWTLTSESENRINAMLRLARSRPEIADSGVTWDLDPYVIGTPSGYVDLSNGGKFKKASHSVRVLQSISTDIKAGKPKRWIQFLQEVLGAEELINYMHRALGYSLTGDISERALFCLYGLGKNGKSTFLETVMRIVGSYGYTMPFSTIEHMKHEGVSNDIASLAGKRFIAASEIKEGTRLNEGRVKSLTGNDHITARFLHKEYFTFKPQAKFWLAFNHKPVCRDDTESYWDRVKLIPFNIRIEESKKDKHLQEKLGYEAGQILGWLIEGAMEWKRNGLSTSRIIEAETEKYKAESNPLLDFLEECCEVGNFAVPIAILRETYQGWCTMNGDRFPLGSQTFNIRLENQGFIRDKVWTNGHAVKVWKGLKVIGTSSIILTTSDRSERQIPPM